MRNNLRHEDSAKTFDQDMQKKMCLKNKWTHKQTGWDVVMILAVTWSVANSMGMYGTFWTHTKNKKFHVYSWT